MAKLTDKQKLFIVKALACYDTPTQVAAAVKEEFGIEVARTQVSKYDPTKEAGCDLSAKLCAIFDATRAGFIEQVKDIPISSQAFRLRALGRMLNKVESQGNVPLAAQILEQAAKEAGGAFTNRREVTGKGGGPIQQNTMNTTLTPGEFADIARQVASEV